MKEDVSRDGSSLIHGEFSGIGALINLDPIKGQR
jgi:hypothetical protein